MPMILSRVIKIVFAVAIALCSIMAAAAQDYDYDYRLYKYYDEEECLPLPSDSIFTASRSYNLLTLRSHNAQNTLSNYGFRPRGREQDEAAYLVGGIILDRYSATHLMTLGIRQDRYTGIGHTSSDAPSTNLAISGATIATYNFRLGLERDKTHERQMVRGEFSGRGYTAGISHRATWKPARNGIRLDDDWSITHYARLRTGRDLHIDALHTNSLNLAAEFSRTTRRSGISIIAMLPYSERADRQHSYAEAFALTGNNLYNPSWGFQSGKMRNSRVIRDLSPEVIALWDYRLSAATTLRLAADIGIKMHSTSALAWYDAPTPMPDNYHYLPSYANDASRPEVTSAWTTNNTAYTQINWDDLYHTNALQSDGHARYAVDLRRENITHTAASAHLESSIGAILLSGDIILDYTTSRHFKVMDDLLGADHIIDLDYYNNDDNTYNSHRQNDLRHPDRVIHEGDRYAYDYRLSTLRASLHGSLLWHYDAGSLSAAVAFATESIERRGYYEKELFPGSGSYGRSGSKVLSPYRLALAWHHNIDIHTFGLSATLSGKSPNAKDIFLQPEYNNRKISDIGLRTTLAFEATYILTLSDILRLESSLFALTTFNDSRTTRHYDNLARTFVNCSVRGIDYANIGLELSARIAWTQCLHSTITATAMSCRYTDDANVALYSDADNTLLSLSRATMRGHNIGTPEMAIYGDVEYSRAGWQLRAAVTYCGLRYVAPSFVRRSERVLNIASSDEHRTMLTTQQRLSDVATIDLKISKMFRLERANIGIDFSVRNLLGSSAVQRGYEQDRIIVVTQQHRQHIEPLADRLLYSYPRTYYLSATIWF